MTMYNISQTIPIKIIIRNESFQTTSSKWERKDEKKLIKVYTEFFESSFVESSKEWERN